MNHHPTLPTFGEIVPDLPTIALPRRVEAPKGKPYTCPELRSHHDLPRARLAAFDMPSRMGDRLHYRDGRVEVVA